jgi:hypothetical protein
MSVAVSGEVIPIRRPPITLNHVEWAARGFGPSLLPVIPPGAAISPNSSVPPDQCGKIPGTEGPYGWRSFDWRAADATPANHAAWTAMGAGVGLRGDAFPSWDIDVSDASLAAALRRAVEAACGPSWARIGRAPRLALPYRSEAPLRPRCLKWRVSEDVQMVDLRAAGYQTVIDGVHPGTGRPYAWPDGRPSGASALGVLTEDIVDKAFAAVALLLDLHGIEPAASSGSADRGAVDQSGLSAPSPEVLADAVRHLPNDGTRHGWITTGHAIKAAGGELGLWEAWSNTWEGGAEDPDDLARRWDGFEGPFSVGWGWIESHARGAGWTGAAAADFASVAAAPVDAESAATRGDDGKGRNKPKARTIIHFRSAKMHELADVAIKALRHDQSQPPVFRFAGSIASVVPREASTSRDLQRGDKAAGCVVQVLNEHALRDRLLGSCRVFLHDRNEPREEAAPLEWCRLIQSRRGAELPLLLGVATAPTLREDGSMVNVAGYDAVTGLWLDFVAEDFEGLASFPTRQDAETALSWLRANVLEGFPFASEADEAVAISSFLTALVRRTSGPAPMFLFVAPAPGTGKTSLAELITALAFGVSAPPQPWPSDENEREKTLLAVLRNGANAVLFDNIADGLAMDSAALARAITAEKFAARILGASETCEVPSSALWLASGNNVRPTGDLATRSLECQLDAGMERPDQRHHRRHDLSAWAAANRTRAVIAGLTILRGYVVAGRPTSIATPSRFSSWDRSVRSALAWAWGVDHIAAKVGGAYAEDPTRSAHHRLMEAWGRVFGAAESSTGDVVAALTNGAAEFDSASNQASLRSVLESLSRIPPRGCPSPEWVGRAIA